jgi:prepilin-type N-terminal cleavage/methylation domain-containing protein
MRASKLTRQASSRNPGLGFSLLEMLVSIAIIVLLMSAVFPFLFQAQKRFQGNVVTSEANQSARAALEVMSQEIGQAGYNPQFSPNKTSATAINLNGATTPYWCINIPNANGGITGINPGDWVSLDSVETNPTPPPATVVNQELLEVFATSDTGVPNDISGTPETCLPSMTAPWIWVKPLMNHTAPFAVNSYKMPYASGILVKFDTTTGNLCSPSNLSANCTAAAPNYLSYDTNLMFFGDINQDGVINYVIYSISPMTPATTVTINGVVYTLYNLYRSITPVNFTSLPVGAGAEANNPASPMVEKVLYNTTTHSGPTGKPIFAYPDHVQIGTFPNVYTALGTIVITLSVAVNPQALESGRVQWSTMATQIRPLNLAAAINVNNSNGGLYIPPTPKTLPMTYPANYYP